MYAWYRSDLLADPKEKEGFKAKYGYDLAPAADWKQYHDIAEWFTRPDQRLYGTALQGKRHEALWYEWLNFLYSFGGDMLEVKSGSQSAPGGHARDRWRDRGLAQAPRLRLSHANWLHTADARTWRRGTRCDFAVQLVGGAGALGRARDVRA